MFCHAAAVEHSNDSIAGNRWCHYYTSTPQFQNTKPVLTTTDALKFDGINTTSEYDSSGLFLLQQYSATTKPVARV
eukprot:3517905-Pyramimonas_sp.AAC.1